MVTEKVEEVLEDMAKTNQCLSSALGYRNMMQNINFDNYTDKSLNLSTVS